MNRFFLVTILGIAFLWIRSGTLKIIEGDFPHTLGDTLTRFSVNNPYPWYSDILMNTSIPNAYVLGFLIMYSEVFSGVLVGVVSLLLLLRKTPNRLVLVLFFLGLVIGMILNLMFWLASGHLSPSGDSLNLLMFYIQFVGVFFVIGLLRKKEAIKTNGKGT